MKVTNDAPLSTQALEKAHPASKIIPSAKAQAEALSGTHAPATPGATVEISEKAQLVRKANEVAHSAPDVRAEKVAALKKKIAEGTYKVDSGRVADKLVEEHLQTDFGKNNS